MQRIADEVGHETGEDVSVDTTSQPGKLYLRLVLYAALYEAYDSLIYREQRTAAKRLGFCATCWSAKKAVLINGEVEYKAIKSMPFEEISHSASRKSDKASERTFSTAIRKMKSISNWMLTIATYSDHANQRRTAWQKPTGTALLQFGCIFK